MLGKGCSLQSMGWSRQVSSLACLFVCLLLAGCRTQEKTNLVNDTAHAGTNQTNPLIIQLYVQECDRCELNGCLPLQHKESSHSGLGYSSLPTDLR